MSILDSLRNTRYVAWKVYVSLAIGLAVTICGATPYYRPDLAAGGVFDVLFKVTGAMFMVGLLVVALLGGNVHGASLTIAVVVNWLLYSFVLFMILRRRKN
jgi:quinol-cytochrome oxidoreductase complex cytochrome b subunit